MKAATTFLFIIGITLLSNATVTFEKRDSQHIREIMTAWDANKGQWLYESLNALVMQSDFPERTEGVIETPAELIAKMDDSRRNRIATAAERELDNERAANAGGDHYWSVWLRYFRRSSCTMTQGRSNGDPHFTTFDGEKYDFQTAGEYLLVESYFSNMKIQTRQKRHNEHVSVNAAAVLNVNGDIVSFYAQDFPDMNSANMIRVNGEVLKNAQSPIYLKNGGVIRFNNGRHVVNWPSGEQMQVKRRTFSNSALLDIDVFIPECEKESYSGLLSDVVRIPTMNLPSSATIARNGGINPQRDAANVFGAGRNDRAVRDQERERLRFMAEEFGDQYLIDTDKSMFEVPMGILPPELRFPTNYITLSELTDEQIKDAMDKCRKAGVAEEDLMDCVYDLGYVGLSPDLPPVHDNSFARKDTNKPQTEPTQVQPNRPANNNPPVMNPRRRNRGVIVIPPPTNNPQTPRGGQSGSSTPPRGTRTGAN
jgi:hypothetical protein